MSRETPGEMKAAQHAAKHKSKSATFSHSCAVLGGPNGPIIAAGSHFGPGVSVNTSRIILRANANADQCMGFSINFPLGEGQKANEEAGFGVRYNRQSPKLQCSVSP